VNEADFDAFVADAKLETRRVCVEREVCRGPGDPSDVVAAETLYMAQSPGLCALDKLIAKKREEKRRAQSPSYQPTSPAYLPEAPEAPRSSVKPQRRVSMAWKRGGPYCCSPEREAQFSPTALRSAADYSPGSPSYSCTSPCYSPKAPAYGLNSPHREPEPEPVGW
jgi:hypothetical protein